MVALLGISIPVFWLGLLLMYMFSLTLGILPTAGDDGWRNYIMPTITLAVFSLAFIARMTRSSLLEAIGQDYVRTARAKGLTERSAIILHALRNALLPIVTVVGLRFGYMLGGAVITEQVFAWPGMGRLLITSVSQRDIPVVQGVCCSFSPPPSSSSIWRSTLPTASSIRGSGTNHNVRTAAMAPALAGNAAGEVSRPQRRVNAPLQFARQHTLGRSAASSCCSSY